MDSNVLNVNSARFPVFPFLNSLTTRAGGRVGVCDGPEWFRESWPGRAVEDSAIATRRGLHSTFLWPTQIPASLGMRDCVVMMPTEVLDELLDPVDECLTPEVASKLVALRAPRMSASPNRRTGRQVQ